MCVPRVLTVSGVLMCLLGGCANWPSVGPDYEPSSFAEGAGLAAALKDDGAGGGDVVGKLAGWWRVFDDPQLTALVARALAANREVTVAEAKIREARARLVIAGAGALPMVGVGGSYQRYQTSKNNSPFVRVEGDQFQAGFDATWEIDLFGGTRRRVEAAQAGLEAVEAGRDAVWVSLAAEVANTYVGYRTAQQRLRVVRANAALQEETYSLNKSRVESGLTSELPLQQSVYNLENTRSQIPPLEAALENYANALALLVGVFPGELHGELETERDIPSAARWTLEAIPSECVRMRPDVRVAERQVAVASANVGVATADLYPKFSLLGSIGLGSVKAADVLSGDSVMYSLGPQVSWPIFRGGSIRNNIRAQTAVQEQALAGYEQTVLNAVSDVRNVLMAYDREYTRYENLTSAVEAAQQAMTLSEELYRSGLTDFYNVLEAQRSVMALQEGLVVSRGTISQHLVSLYKALGGGWQGVAEE
ncbi:MAG: efflux transporter outer membrane subunit [Kiritimatiellaeota bacterium]|nr:efflux transporter outer membrane subunit [Kiritimatiellota bacterium]